MQSKEQLIATLQLEPLVEEGGYYKRIYESQVTGSDGRHYAASIYYLLESTDFSCFHRLDCDELWHFYAGASLTIYQINSVGELKVIRLGNPLEDNAATPFALLEKGTWFAAEVLAQHSFALVGCTTVPEFLFSQFEAAERAALTKTYPQHAALIERLTRVN